MKATFVVHPDYEHLKPELEKVLKNFPVRGEYVTQGDRNVIKKVAIGDMVFNIKKFKTPHLLQGLVYQFLRKSKARRSFEYAKKLIDLGIVTPFPVCYSERFSGGLKESFYISLHVEYDFDFRSLLHNPKFPDREEIVKQFARFTFNLHEANINFLDHSPGNTLIVKEDKTPYQFYLIDLNRMRFEPLSFDRRMHNFRRLWLSKTMIRIIAEEYAIHYPKPACEIHTLLLKYSKSFQNKVNRKKLRRRKR